jgi:hypothetical protein
MTHWKIGLRRLSLALAITVGLGLANGVVATPRIYVRVAPPPVVVETRPVAPGPNHIWIDGFHRWDGNAYVWAPGRWEARPRAHSVWVKGRWAHHARGWYWVDGRWRR